MQNISVEYFRPLALSRTLVQNQNETGLTSQPETLFMNNRTSCCVNAGFLFSVDMIMGKANKKHPANGRTRARNVDITMI